MAMVFEYIGPANSEVTQNVESQVQRRKALEEKLSQVNKNLSDVDRLSQGCVLTDVVLRQEA